MRLPIRNRLIVAILSLTLLALVCFTIARNGWSVLSRLRSYASVIACACTPGGNSGPGGNALDACQSSASGGCHLVHVEATEHRRGSPAPPGGTAAQPGRQRSSHFLARLFGGNVHRDTRHATWHVARRVVAARRGIFDAWAPASSCLYTAPHADRNTPPPTRRRCNNSCL